MSQSGLVFTSEYQQVVNAVVQCLLNATHDSRLPELTPDQVHYWLTHLRPEDVDHAFSDLGLGRRPSRVA